MASKKGFKPPAKKSEKGMSLTDSQYEEIFDAVINKYAVTGDSAGHSATEPKESASLENSQHSQPEKQITKPKTTDTSSISTLYSEDFLQKAVSSTPMKKIEQPKSFRESLKSLKQKMDSGSLDTSLCSSIQEILEDVPLSQPPKHLTHLQKMLWLQDRRGTGLWIKCDFDKCGKWRWADIPDPVDLPDKWFCHMNTDKTLNSCSYPEKAISRHVEEDLIHNKYTAGSIVWARMRGYPWWPAIVCDDPDTEQYYWLELFGQIPTSYHVTFFDSAAVTRSWITPTNLISFKHHPDYDRKFSVKSVFKNRIAFGKKQAEDALALHIKDRLKKYSYVARCPNNVHTPIPSSDESETELEKERNNTTKKNERSGKTNKLGLKSRRNSARKSAENSLKMTDDLPNQDEETSGKVKKLGVNSRRNSAQKSVKNSQKMTKDETLNISHKSGKNSKKSAQSQEKSSSGKTKRLGMTSRRNSQKMTDNESDIETPNLHTSFRTNNSCKSGKSSKKNSPNQEENSSGKAKKLGGNSRRSSLRKSTENDQKMTDNESDIETPNLNTSFRTNNSRKSGKISKKNSPNKEENSSKKTGVNSRNSSAKKSAENSQKFTDNESDNETPNLNTSFRTKNSRKSGKISKKNSPNKEANSSKKPGVNSRGSSARKSAENSQKIIDDGSEDENTSPRIISRKSEKNSPNQDEETSGKVKKLGVKGARKSKENSQKMSEDKPNANPQNNKRKSGENTDDDQPMKKMSEGMDFQKNKIMSDFLKDVVDQTKVQVRKQKRFCSPFLTKVNKNDSIEIAKSKETIKRKVNETVLKSTPKKRKNTFVPPFRNTLNTSFSSLEVTSTSTLPDNIFDDDFDSEMTFSAKK